MKKIEKIAIILIGLWLITRINGYVFYLVSIPLVGAGKFFQIKDLDKLLTLPRSLVPVLVQVGIGIWLFQQASQEGRSRWIWGLFGLTFGISAAILYFLMQLVEQAQIK